jgi:hypothetical protein
LFPFTFVVPNFRYEKGTATKKPLVTNNLKISFGEFVAAKWGDFPAVAGKLTIRDRASFFTA